MKSFASFHPIVIFVYYVAVIILTMFMMHPFILGLSLFGSLVLFALMNPIRVFWRDICFYALFFLLIAITNPIFVHKGETILFFLNDNPVTLEAIIYGFAVATMLVAVIFWSKSYNDIITSDKFIYLFGKIVPKLSLIISIALRFIPLFKEQIKKVNQTQKTLGLYTSKSISDRVLSGIRLFNSLITWALENSIQQADAMKAQGYGLKGRTNFSLFYWYVRDIIMLTFILLIFGSIMFLYVKDSNHFTYYPIITKIPLSIQNICQFVLILILMILPSLIEVKEIIQWKYLKSKM
ncbi:energy-coupling factor transporter transmembrane component T [Pseudogracilibacillus sp. SO30301A]|uniref:energy-coupling factor transporter transmembrane component T n=1 Tax=Pseudogracilibacillus sp. SO30301A TaxID=3098291 RepID=UPI00300E1E2A